MALINCPNCGKEISDKAEKCPGCATQLKEVKNLKDIVRNVEKNWQIMKLFVISVAALLKKQVQK